MKRETAVLLLLAAFFLGMSTHQTITAQDDTRWDVIGGVVADRGDGWHIHRDRHSARHLRSATCKGRYLLVRHTPGVNVPIWHGPDVDESLRSPWDITASVSATRSEARIFFDIDGEPISCWHRAFRQSRANVWLGGDIELAVSS